MYQRTDKPLKRLLKEMLDKMKTTIVLPAFLVLGLALFGIPVYATPPVATISNVKLVDRVCTVEDGYNLQPAIEKYCTLTFRETFPGTDGIHRKWTVYCPNGAVDGNPANLSFDTCKDTAGMVINPTKSYTVTGWLRTSAQAADGKGQVAGYAFSY